MIKITLPVVGLGLLLSPVAHSQVTIFDTSSNMPNGSLTVADGEEVADDASLAALGATITDLELFLITFQASGSITADVTAAIYADNGSSAPGAQLWTETKLGESFPTSESSVLFSNINTNVDQDFFWSVRLDNVVADAGAIWGPRLGVAANVAPAGASTDPVFFYTDPDGTGFIYTEAKGSDSTLGVRITGIAIPEPATATSLLLGMFLLAGRRRARS